MKFNEFPEATSLLDDDVLLFQETATLAIKKVKLSTIKQYIGVTSTGSASSIKDEILKDNPIGYWQLDETASNVANNLGSGMSNGIYNNVVLGQLPLAKGSVKSALFNGTTSNVSFTNTLLNANADISIECLINLASLSLKGSFVKLGTGGVGIGLGVGGSTQDNVGNNLIAISENIAWKPTNVPIGTGTHHVGLVFKGFTSKEWLFYLDGFLVATLPPQSISNPNDIGLIGMGDYSRYVNSLIDEVAIYNKALPPVRWLAHANTVIY